MSASNFASCVYFLSTCCRLTHKLVVPGGIYSDGRARSTMAISLWGLCMIGFVMTVVFVVLFGFGTTDMCGLTAKFFPEKDYSKDTRMMRRSNLGSNVV